MSRHRTGVARPASSASWPDHCEAEAEAENTVGAADPAIPERAIERAQVFDSSLVAGVATVTPATSIEERVGNDDLPAATRLGVATRRAVALPLLAEPVDTGG